MRHYHDKLCDVCRVNFNTIKDSQFGGHVCVPCAIEWDLNDLKDRLLISTAPSDTTTPDHSGLPSGASAAFRDRR